MAYQQDFLLNLLLTKSITKAPDALPPPTHGARELFEILEKRAQQKIAIEFVGGRADDDVDDEVRIKRGLELRADFINLREVRFVNYGGRDYVALLIDYVDQSQKSLPVVDVSTFISRELHGGETECGIMTAHALVRLPMGEEPDECEYRLVIERVNGVTRKYIEFLLSRQLRRFAESEEWGFSVVEKRKRKDREKSYKYYPRIDLSVEISRAILAAQKVLSHVIFTQKSVRYNTAQETDVINKDWVADVEIRVSGKQAPEGQEAKRAWLEALKRYYEGYTTRLYFRTIGGGITGGEMKHDEAVAADVLMCPREMAEVAGTAEKLRPQMLQNVIEAMVTLIEREGIWQRVH